MKLLKSQRAAFIFVQTHLCIKDQKTAKTFKISFPWYFY